MRIHCACILLALLTSVRQSSESEPAEQCLELLQMANHPPNDIYIGPDLKRISGWSDDKSIFSGVFEVDFDWNLTAFVSSDNKQTDMRDIMSLEELITGNSGRIKGSNFDWRDCVTFYEHRRTWMTYMGDFAQDVDGTCYPFDEVTVKFTLWLKSDWASTWRMKLFCKDNSDCVAYDPDGNVLEVTDPWLLWGGVPYNFVVSKTVVSQPFSAKGFAWSPMTCQTSSSSARIDCSLTGMRYWHMPFAKWVIPGLVMIIIGFSSVFMPVTLKMPRVATSMIAMLTFVNRSTAAFNALPATGTSWILEFYMFGTAALCVTMIGHVASFRNERLSVIIGDLVLAIGFFGVIFCLAFLLHVRKCVQVLRGLTLTATIIAAFCFVGFLVRSAYKYKAIGTMLEIKRSLSHKRHLDQEEEEEEEKYNMQTLETTFEACGDGAIIEASQLADWKTAKSVFTL